MSGSSYCFLTCIQVSQEAGKVVRYSHLFKNFPQFGVILLWYLEQGLEESNVQIKTTIIIITTILIVEYYGATENDIMDWCLLMWKDVSIIQVRNNNRNNIYTAFI